MIMLLQDASCQKQDWKRHKKTCGVTQFVSDEAQMRVETGLVTEDGLDPNKLQEELRKWSAVSYRSLLIGFSLMQVLA